MSNSPDSDSSIPSLSSYPPSFVSLIITFIKRAEEAETRAHKALVILKAKDDQVIQLQKRMEVLENVASRLESAMVPPLDLPKSPDSFEELSGPHPRDTSIKSNHLITESYQTCNYVPQEKESSHIQNGHNCYEKCQYLIDGLERSNCQLREALEAESQDRMRDHEQYVATMAEMTQAFKDLQNKHSSQTQHVDVQHSRGDIPDVVDETLSISGAAGDAPKPVKNKVDSSLRSDQMVVFDNTDIKKKVDLAESIISVLQFRLEKRQSKKNKSSNTLKGEKSLFNTLSKRSLSSNNTLKSSSTLKLKRVHISSHCFINALKKQNAKLKKKYYHVCKNFTESLTLCEKLQKELICRSNRNKKNVESKVEHSTQSTQTEDFSIISHPSRSTNILQGRLEAAAKVMAKQCKQIQDLQKQLGESFGQIEPLRKRLARAEAAAVGKEMLGEATKKQLQDLEKRNLVLSQEVQQVKDSCSHLRQELAFKTDECNNIQREKDSFESEFQEMKISLETKLLSLSTALQEKEQFNDQRTGELQKKLSSLREQFIAHLTDASDRLVAADFKIQELYLGIETFLKLLFNLNSLELSPSSQAQAVQVASDILQLPPEEVQNILHSSRCDARVIRRIKECNRMIHEKVFAKNLGNLLLDAVLEATIP